MALSVSQSVCTFWKCHWWNRSNLHSSPGINGHGQFTPFQLPHPLTWDQSTWSIYTCSPSTPLTWDHLSWIINHEKSSPFHLPHPLTWDHQSGNLHLFTWHLASIDQFDLVLSAVGAGVVFRAVTQQQGRRRRKRSEEPLEENNDQDKVVGWLHSLYSGAEKMWL